MNPIDAVIMALSPATPFNPQSKVWRSADALAQFAGITKPELQDLIAGDLAAQAVCRPSKKPEKGFLVALKSQLPAEAPPLPGAEDFVAGEVPGPNPKPQGQEGKNKLYGNYYGGDF